MIVAQHLLKSFGNIKAVDDLSFTIKKGEIVGLLGPNGAGKTTTMRLLTGFLSPDKGEITINGISVLENPIQVQSHIGYLPENNPLYQEMLVCELLELSANLKGLSGEKKKAFDFAVSAVHIADVFYRRVAELSKGYKQRVGLALALLHRPEILIMDEPTEGLDPNQRVEIRTLIKKLAKDHTIIVSTHVMQEVEAVCNRLIIINKGKLVADGTSEQLSRSARKESCLLLEIEGKNIVPSLRTLKNIKDINISDGRGRKVLVKIITKPEVSLQPEISTLAHKNRWIIWKMIEEKQQLEDVFHALTSET